MTRDEAIAEIKKLCSGELSDKESHISARRVMNEFPNTYVLDLIFQDMRNLTPEQVVDEAIELERQHEIKLKSEKPIK